MVIQFDGTNLDDWKSNLLRPSAHDRFNWLPAGFSEGSPEIFCERVGVLMPRKVNVHALSIILAELKNTIHQQRYKKITYELPNLLNKQTV